MKTLENYRKSNTVVSLSLDASKAVVRVRISNPAASPRAVPTITNFATTQAVKNGPANVCVVRRLVGSLEHPNNVVMVVT